MTRGSISVKAHVELMAVACLFFLNGCQSLTQPEVKIQQGVVRGIYMTTQQSQKQVASFLGIPYAEPPVQQYRYRNAVPAKPFGVLNATSYKSKCIQYERTPPYGATNVVGSEDCLYLNVYSSKLPSQRKATEKPLKVIFYIQGGAFSFLSGNTYGPDYIMEKDVVLVTFTFRMGAIGFLSTQDDVVPGNIGLKDQLLALKWVKNNINKFGGDPEQITLAGQSTGSGSVHYHVLSPLSKGLFVNAIMMSGTALNPRLLTDKPLEKARKLASLVGCTVSSSQAMVECLRTKSAEDIIAASKQFVPTVFTQNIPFGPVIEPALEGAFLSEQPVSIIENGKASDVPLLISRVNDEGLYPTGDTIKNNTQLNILLNTWDNVLDKLLDYNDTLPMDRRQSVARIIRSRYIQDKLGSDAIPGLVLMAGDRLFNVGVEQAAKLHAKHYKSPVFSYVFDFKGPHRNFEAVDVYDGVSHADDLLYVLRSTSGTNIGNDTKSLQVANYMTDLWIDFMSGMTERKIQHDLKPTLPAFAYLKINGANQKDNPFIVDDDSEKVKFWTSLGFQENQNCRTRSLMLAHEDR